MTRARPSEVRAVLDEHPFFHGLDPVFLTRIEKGSHLCTFDRGEFIAREGALARSFHAIIKGTVALEFAGPDGVAVKIQTVGAGEIVGWSALTAPFRYTVDARAIEPTHTLCIDSPVLGDALREDPAAGYQFMMRIFPVLSERLHNTMVQVFELRVR